MRLRGATTLLLFAVASSAAAQRVEVAGRGDIEWDVRLREMVRSDAYVVFTHDTLIARGDTVPASVLAPGVTVRLEGVITGDLVGIDANLFLRPHGRVRGNVVNVAGGFYPSELAVVEGSVTDEPNAPYDVERRGDVLRIVGTESRSLLQLEGFRGIQPPSYDRVDGVSLAFGGRYLLPRLGLLEPFVGARATYHSQRGNFGGRGEVGVRRRGTELAFGAERHTVTNEEWIRGDVLNSLSFLWKGKDHRNYHETDCFYAELRRSLERGTRTTTATLALQAEDARPLVASDPWTVLEPDSIRFNPPISAGRISSAVLRLASEWELESSAAELMLELEGATETLGGDFGFGRFLFIAEYAMRALANHTLEVEGYFQGPLPGTDSLPRQRWSFVGGSGTLYTYELGRFPGDRVAFVETEYSIPLPELLDAPFIGRPNFDVLH
ncbi:MAG: hypothetical protein ACRELX_02575, partial [Longimicrobiales bacterium]